MAFNILEEYQRAVRSMVAASGCSEDMLQTILKDLYAADEIYLSLNRPYEHASGTFADFCTKHQLHDDLRKMFPDFRVRNLYIHQVRAIESILEGRTTIISTGTGSGKTESFLIPVLDYCLKHQRTPGIKAVILYPINALAGDQLRRIKKAAEHQAITVGSFVGSTSQGERTSMIRNPPDILITNYVMLDRLITKERPRSMFERSKQTLRFLVVDEIHYYRGTKGANLCLLLRRLRTLCTDKNQLIQIGASATLRQGGGYYSDNDQEQIETFARSLFGQEATQNFKFITAIYDDTHITSEEVDPLPTIDQLIDEPLGIAVEPTMVRKLAEQLAEVPLPHPRPGSRQIDPLYLFAKRNQFLQKLREKLQSQACTIDELVELFRQVYIDNHQQEPCQPREMVYAYLSVVNELNRCYTPVLPSVPKVLLDYRLHLILSDLKGSLTRCLRCGRFHDGSRTHCTVCNGLLFKVSKKQPDLCLARCNSLKLWPRLHASTGDTRHTFTVLVQPLLESLSSMDSQGTCFAFEPDLDANEDDENYLLRPLQDGTSSIRVLRIAEGECLQELELEHPRLYWQNVQRLVDAILIKPETKIASKMLGFIDNREKASGIRLRLRDELADRALTRWAAAQWAASGTLSLITAYSRLEKQAQQYIQQADADSVLRERLQEMPFWFARFLTRLNEYNTWQVRLAVDIGERLQADEYSLLNEVFLPQGAIDRTAFQVPSDTGKLKHFFLEKYRVATEYGIGLKSVKEAGYDIVSLGEQGRIYQHLIERIGATRIENLISELCKQDRLISKQSRDGASFYQLNPHYLTLECLLQQVGNVPSDLPPTLIECHTADHTSEERADLEKRFSVGKIHALICTPTLEMGVDIGDLSCVTMIGFPPSPANYAQRAGRAGRKSTLRSATIIVLSSFGSNHDAYYAAAPFKMIDGTITPPQFTLANLRLLAAHVYAYLLGGEHLKLLSMRNQLDYRLEQFIAKDEFDLRSELGDEYESLLISLRKDISRLSIHLHDHEQGYRRGFFPDYGFRKDGIPLLDPATYGFSKEDNETGVLTRREPEEAVRKLAPGRIVYCGGRPVRVDQNQSNDTYTTVFDPEGCPFRAYKHLVAEEKDELYVYARKDTDTLYLVKRKLLIKEPVQQLQGQGPGYCHMYLVRTGTLYLINEGTYAKGEESGQISAIPFQAQPDQDSYRFGASLTRDGLLLSFSDQLLSPDTIANFLAVLLRSIPDYFNLDDGELRTASNVELYSSHTAVSYSDQKYIFLYGHDESGLIPFERIFEHLPTLLTQHLQTLESCSCDDDGCYHCLFSLNSQYLTGILSRRQAATFLRAYLRLSLLQPHILQKAVVPNHHDVYLKVEWRGKSTVKAENRLTKTTTIYEGDGQDQNTAIYIALNAALTAEATGGARTVHILCSPPYIHDQLQGKANVTKGKEAFFQVMLALGSWESWTSVPERGK